jgi:TonB-dependent starch-binding outer membrane protein SusC
LELAVSGLSDVVVVGYGISSVKKLTTSVSTVKARDVNEMPINNVANAFTGDISGVAVEQQGGPGAQPVLRVRGYGSINAGSEPLYVIDGMIVTSYEFGLLSPKSIESINVLKDAAAGAIYGSRAANGVVIVTTKSGEGEVQFNYNLTAGIDRVARKIPVLSGPEYIDYAKKAFSAAGQPEPVFSPDVANTNWQDEIFRTAPYQNHRVSASGSNKDLKYNLAFNYIDNQGIIITTYEKRYSLNGKFDFKLSEKLKMGLTFDGTFSKRRTNPKLGGAAHGAGGILEDAIVQYPVIPVYMPDGDYGQQTSKDWGTSVAYGGYGNPVAALKEIHDVRSAFSGRGRTFINYEPIRNLNFNLSLSGSSISGSSEYLESPYLAANGHDRVANFSNPIYEQIVANQSNDLFNRYITEGFVDYKRTFSSDHDFGIVAGFSSEYAAFRQTSAAAAVNNRGANAVNPLPAFDNYLRPNIFGANDISGNGGYYDQAFTSLFGRLNYSYKDKYLFTASIRRDGSSKFAPNNRYGIFPALSAAWRITEESFMDNQKLFSDLKLRASYGVSGNDQIGNYAWQGRANYGGQYYFGPSDLSNGAVTIEYPLTIENPNLKWETNTQYNAGIDMSLLKNKIQLTADFYVRKTKDLLLQKPLPSENGIANSIMDNIGSVTNKGIELALNTTNISTADFNWNTKWIFNKVWNRAETINAPNGIIRLESGEFDMVWIVQGQQIFQIYGYKTLGVFKTEEQLEKYPRPRDSQIGDPILEDVNGDGVINSDDFVKLGNALPDFTYGWSNNFTYKNWDLRIVVDGSNGASKYVPSFRNQSWVSPLDANLTKYLYDRAGTVYGEPSMKYTGNRATQNSHFVFDASYTRIKNITLGFNMPERVCKSLAITGLRLSLSATNLHTFSSYPWYDVQSNYYNGAAGTAQYGVDFGSYPLATTYAFGINLTF